MSTASRFSATPAHATSHLPCAHVAASGKVKLVLSNGDHIMADKVLVAVGIEPNVDLARGVCSHARLASDRGHNEAAQAAHHPAPRPFRATAWKFAPSTAAFLSTLSCRPATTSTWYGRPAAFLEREDAPLLPPAQHFSFFPPSTTRLATSAASTT